MPNFIYPTQTLEGTLSAEQVHLLLKSPQLIAKRIADISKQRYIADYLLSGRFSADGGGVFYETGEEIHTADAPEAIAPGAEYPMTVMTGGEIAAAKTVKWGRATDLTDELIAQQGVTALNKRLQSLANANIAHVDAIAMSVISSKVTSTENSSAWNSPGAIVEALTRVNLTRSALGTGLDLSTVVLNPADYAKVMGMLLDKGALPRETSNPALNGMPVNVFGYTWTTSPHYTGANPLFVDTTALGGMADQKGLSPDYASVASMAVEAKVTRRDEDKYRIQARRVTVPVVTEPLAGVQITGTGL